MGFGVVNGSSCSDALLLSRGVVGVEGFFDDDSATNAINHKAKTRERH